MADIYCTCGEPWDLDSLHEHIAEQHDYDRTMGIDPPWYTNGRYDDQKYSKLFSAARQEFRQKGCAMFGSKCSNAHPAKGAAFEALSEMMGDDVDGAIAMMEDADHLF